MSAHGSERDDDPSEYAEAARDAGLSHYMMLSGIRQEMLNLFAAALFHTFEQQVMFFLRRQLLHPSEEHDHTLLTGRYSVIVSGSGDRLPEALVMADRS